MQTISTDSVHASMLSGICCAMVTRSSGQAQPLHRHSVRTCSMPLSAQQTQNHVREAPKPKVMLMAAVAIRPPASSTVGEILAPSTPLTNLLMPYAMGNTLVMAPICVMSMPSRGSATITGAVYVSELRVR
jgi:hypothetical protein